MLGLFVLGGLIIMPLPDLAGRTNGLMLVGLACLLGGLYTPASVVAIRRRSAVITRHRSR